MNILEFLRAIDGQAQLWANDGQFLGVLSSNQYDPNSICNPNGIYGSSYSATSIRAEYSMYGGEYGMHSPYNPYCLNPPAIFYQNQKVLVVTRNAYAMTNGIQVIDPDLLFITYSSSAHAAPEPQQFTFEQQVALQDMHNRAMMQNEMLRQYTEMRRQNMEFLMNLNGAGLTQP